uniref:M-phase specific PLK1 interacting protein n=1 Tax=Mola mola TaxID=94237 RepID=A0A3Q3X8B5_MOLML
MCVFPLPVWFRCLCFCCSAVESSGFPPPHFSCCLPAQMYRGPVRPQRSPGAPRPPGRFPSPAPCWGFPGPRSPYGGSGLRSGSPRGGGPAFSPSSPGYSPGSNRGYRSGSPAGLGGGGGRGFGGQMWHVPVEKYFSPSMLQDPWAALPPIKITDRKTSTHRRQTTL